MGTLSLRLLPPLVAANLVAWGLAIACFHGSTVLMGAAVLAYALGCRHAVDADHIAAIDNITRKLIQSRRPAAATGLYFSLGHSTVVWLASLGIAATVTAAGPQIALLQRVGGILGVAVSAFFLFGIAAANVVVLKGIVGAIRRRKRGEPVAPKEIDDLASYGLYARLLKPVFRLVSKSRHMFVVGILFGLGFDTATEIGVLGLSAAAAGGGLPIWFILLFPALFTAGMSLIDTLDSAMMAGAYGWAFAEPTRKLYYNLTITFASVIAAVAVGGLELAALLSNGHSLAAGVLDRLGYLIIALFGVLWMTWAVRHRVRSAFAQLRARIGVF